MFGQIEFSDPLAIIKMPDVCQLHCRYCFRQYNKKPQLIDYTAEEVMEMLRHYPKIRTMSFLGGEPLIFKDKIKEIIQVTKPRIKKYIITTNGINLKEEDIKFFVENHVQLNISLDGDRQQNDFNRGQGTYDKVMAAIDKIYEVATQLGFEEPAYFTRMFTKIIGMTPTQYRKQESSVHQDEIK